MEAGERFVITQHGRPAAERVPVQTRDSGEVRPAIDALKEFQKTHSLGGLSLRTIIEDAHKY